LLLAASRMDIFMKKNLIYVLALVVLVVIGAVFAKRGNANHSGWHLNNGVQRSQGVQVINNGTTQQNNDDTIMEEEMSMNDKGSVLISNPGQFVDYSPEKVAELGDNRGLLFFNASWCPSCRKAIADIEKNLENIPEDLVIMKIDFDEYGDWGRKNYQVRGQHTYVQIDNEGKLITSWVGGKFKDIINKIDDN